MEKENTVSHNCLTCKKNLFYNCEILHNNEEFKELLDEHVLLNSKAFEFEEKFCCEEYVCRYIEYPIEISGIEYPKSQTSNLKTYEIGSLVRIRPCADEYKNKTYLGVFLGELPNGLYVSYNQEKKLSINYSFNPAIFVPELKKIIYGCESFWSIIDKEEDLKEITDKMIADVPYVAILKTIK